MSKWIFYLALSKILLIFVYNLNITNMSKDKKHLEAHVQISNEIDWTKLKRGDKYIYAIIKSHRNLKTGQCNPGIATLMSECKCGQKRLYETIQRLVDAGLIKVTTKVGSSNQYEFIGTYESFEMFSIKFLKELDLAPQVKEYYMDIQEYLYKHPDSNTAEMTLDNTTLKNITGIPIRTIQRYNAILASQGILVEEILSRKDRAGLSVKKKVFDLEKLQQTVIVDHEERITSIEDRLDKLEEDNKWKDQEIARLKNLLKFHNIDDSEYNKIELAFK